MKFKFSLILIAAIGFLMVSCGDKPETVVEKYYTHFYKAEYKEANKYVVKEKQGLCELLNNYIPETEKSKLAKSEVTVKNIKCKVEDDTTATCSCEIVTKVEGEVKKSEENIKLKKVDNKWLVNQGKEDFMGGEATEDAVAPTSSEEDIISNDSTNTSVETTEVK